MKRLSNNKQIICLVVLLMFSENCYYPPLFKVQYRIVALHLHRHIWLTSQQAIGEAHLQSGRVLSTNVMRHQNSGRAPYGCTVWLRSLRTWHSVAVNKTELQ